MIKSAKVSLSAVKSFEQAVATVRDYSDQFGRGISCFDDFLRFLSDREESLRAALKKIQSAQERLAGKIKSFETDIARFTEKLNDLEDKLLSLKNKLAYTPALYTVIDSEGEEHETLNPAYTAIEARITSVESRIRSVETELYSVQQKLDRANAVDGQLALHEGSITGVIYSLGEKQNTCRQLKTDLEAIQNSNFRRGTIADESLKKIKEIVENYLKIKMVYENAVPSNPGGLSSQGGVRINININRYDVQKPKEWTTQELNQYTISAQDIKEHGIKFDNNGKIALYDGKTFGGKYNSYETRLSRTTFDDKPIWGFYEGDRGESKFIPSGRTVEGVVVIGILNKYGLDGIEYRNAEPDFEVCSEAVVKIKAMSENRENYGDQNGIPRLGNFTQADIECAKVWNALAKDGRTDWDGRIVHDYRKQNGLTWHEKCDTETMVLVRSEINAYFKHSGGCSECRMRDAELSGGGFDE